MVKFARQHQVDYIGISFVETGAHVRAIRELAGIGFPRIVAKIENSNGLNNMAEVIDAADAIMIDRGDLAVETNLENIAIYQKQIIKLSINLGKPVIVATEMLHTMIENSFPTKAEISDISNAVLDGASATMLSGETAVGKNAIAAVKVMQRTATVAADYLQSSCDGTKSEAEQSIPRVMGEATDLLCKSLPITKIIAVTISGFAARSIALRRPRQPILAVSNDAMSARSFNLLSGVTGVCVNLPFSKTSMDHIPACLEELWHRKLIELNDVLLVTAVAYPKSGNRMNLIQTHVVRDLAGTMGWL
jgi:pyruvate kinase